MNNMPNTSDVVDTLIQPRWPSRRRAGALVLAASVLAACYSQSPDDVDKSAGQVATQPADQRQALEERKVGNATQGDSAAAPVTDVAAEAIVVTGTRTRPARTKKMARLEAESLARSADASMGIVSHFSAPTPHPAIPAQGVDRERYEQLKDPGLQVAADSPVSTFSIDVDTGAYSNVRRFLTDGRLPPHDAVRVEELINYFSYGYDTPRGDTPFSVATTVASTPWNPDTLLMQIGIKGRTVDADQRPASNLVFLVDVSGSMRAADKLPLLKDSLTMLSQQLDGDDRVSLVVYAGASGVVLEPTAGNDRARISEALDQLQAGGSTNGESGIRLAYQLAQDAFVEGGINRVVLATDGDFNVGVADTSKLIDLIENKRKSGVSLTTLGFGRGNLNDHLMERLADAGNGNYAYIDSLAEARKVLVSEVGSTLHTIASDVKIQVEFNPAQVAEYRLIGYHNRQLRREDFNNDKVDAGDIGAGHTVTALYEITPVDSDARRVDPLRYAAPASPVASGNELAFVRLRYKAPGEDVSTLLEQPVTRRDVVKPADTSNDFRFAAAVAAFGESLRGGPYLGDYRLDEIRELAVGGRGQDEHGYRAGFVELVDRAERLAQGEDGLGQQVAGYR